MLNRRIKIWIDAIGNLFRFVGLVSVSIRIYSYAEQIYLSIIRITYFAAIGILVISYTGAIMYG